MKQLNSLRKDIDQIDLNMVRLLNQRAQRAIQIGKIKQKQRGVFYAPHREREVIERVRRVASTMPPDDVTMIYEDILHACRSLQKKLAIGYFGPEATFTHQAAQKNFGHQALYIPTPSIGDVFDLVEREQVDYGVVPVENSTEGIVTHTLDMLRSSDLKIVMEINLAIHHYLLSRTRSLKQVKRIYSHPQALAQCLGYLKRNVSKADFIEVSSTAEAAQKVLKDIRGAAVASQLAAKLYGIPVIVQRIEDLHNNATRFLVIGREIPQKTGHDKTSILFSIKDRVGALHDILMPFKKLHVNMTKIESRPERGKAWNYVFYVDFEGHISEVRIAKLLVLVEKSCKFLKFLGSYPKAD